MAFPKHLGTAPELASPATANFHYAAQYCELMVNGRLPAAYDDGWIITLDICEGRE
jgi:hypothetical protein